MPSLASFTRQNTYVFRTPPITISARHYQKFAKHPVMGHRSTRERMTPIVRFSSLNKEGGQVYEKIHHLVLWAGISVWTSSGATGEPSSNRTLGSYVPDVYWRCNRNALGFARVYSHPLRRRQLHHHVPVDDRRGGWNASTMKIP